MKIDSNSQVITLNNLAKASPLKGTGDAPGSSQTVTDSGDKVELSWKDKVASLTERVKALPDVDENKVESMKQAIESGTYNAKGELVAGSMLKSNLLDETL
jgi:flagellar biosynthesis anti-sigma factor FlgM